MDKFSVLPTDIRFINLYEEQKLSIFNGLCMLPDSDIVKRIIRSDDKIQEIKEKKDEEIMSPGLVSKMRQIFSAQGMDAQQIKNKIKEQVERIRATEIKSIEEKMNG